MGHEPHFEFLLVINGLRTRFMERPAAELGEEIPVAVAAGLDQAGRLAGLVPPRPRQAVTTFGRRRAGFPARRNLRNLADVPI
jgi:hypothetical protein